MSGFLAQNGYSDAYKGRRLLQASETLWTSPELSSGQIQQVSRTPSFEYLWISICTGVPETELPG